MTRKKFLKSIAVASAACYVPGQLAAQAAGPKIKRGVSLYSYQEEYFSGAMTLEDSLAEASDIGAKGIEILGEMSVPGFPDPSPAWVDDWHRMFQKYGLTATCYDQFQQTGLYKDRPLTDQEAIRMMERDLRLAKRLGFKIVRLMPNFPIPMIEKCLPSVERFDMLLTIEIHPPAPLVGGSVDEWLALIDRTRTKRFGFVLDLGVFMERPARVMRARQIRDGTIRETIADFIERARQRGLTREQTASEVAKMSGSAGETRWVDTVYNTGINNVKDLKRLMPFVFHIHGKCYELTEDLQEYSIPYDVVIPALIENGYSGYICTEYEGQRHLEDAFEVDSCEQVRRQQVLFRRLLGEI
jgi:sugar phosphate isomerase/epimerase